MNVSDAIRAAMEDINDDILVLTLLTLIRDPGAERAVRAMINASPAMVRAFAECVATGPAWVPDNDNQAPK